MCSMTEKSQNMLKDVFFSFGDVFCQSKPKL